MNNWGGSRTGAGRKKDQLAAARRLQERQLKTADWLLQIALQLRQMGAQPQAAVTVAIDAARRIIRHRRQLNLLLQPASTAAGERAVVAAARKVAEAGEDAAGTEAVRATHRKGDE